MTVLNLDELDARLHQATVKVAEDVWDGKRLVLVSGSDIKVSSLLSTRRRQVIGNLVKVKEITYPEEPVSVPRPTSWWESVVAMPRRLAASILA